MDRIRRPVCALLALVCISLSASASSGLIWTWHNPPHPQTLTAIAFGGGTYVAAGQDGLIYTSHDGSTWSLESSVIGAGGTYLEAIYANGLFLLSGTDAAGTVHVTSSPDGVTWTDAVPGVSGLEGTELAYGNSSYVLMGDGADATSPDGITWTTHTLAFNGVDSPLLFAHGVFMVAHDTDIFYGSDGVTWNAATTTPETSSGVFTTTGSAFYFFQSDGSAVYTSTDGNVWAKHVPTGNPPTGESYMFWDGSHFRTAVFDQDHADQLAFSSNNGLAWTESGVSTTAPLLGPVLAFDGTHYLGTLSDGFLQILRTTDFNNWTVVAVIPNGPQIDFYDIIRAGSVFVAVGTTSATSRPAVAESADGNTWNQVYMGSSNGSFASVAYGNGTFVAVGHSVWASSTDGVSWTAFSNPVADSDVRYGNGRFVVFTSSSSLTSTDGRTWTSHDLPAGLPGALGFDGTRFVAISYDSNVDGSTPVYTSCDGVTWTHSADIPAAGGTQFTRIRAVSSGLLAVGSKWCGTDNCFYLGTQPVVATGKDASHWTGTEIDASDGGDYYAADIASDGNTYYVAIKPVGDSLLYGPSALFSSTTFPALATPNALFNDGTNLYVAGYSGQILSAPVTGGAATATGGACSALPAIPDQLVTSAPPATTNSGKTSSGGGGFDILAIMGLAGLLLSRHLRPSV